LSSNTQAQITCYLDSNQVHVNHLQKVPIQIHIKSFIIIAFISLLINLILILKKKKIVSNTKICVWNTKIVSNKKNQ